MKEMVGAIAYKRLRAPQEDGQALFDPPLVDEAGWLAQNVMLRRAYSADMQGRSMEQLQIEARRELLQAARRFTATYRALPDVELGSDEPFILAGHQPELVHAGVWFKNYVLSALAERTSAHAINLLIDNDAVRATTLRLPTGSIEEPVVTSIPLDRPGAPIPYEERGILDPQLFRSFGDRVADAIRPLVRCPIVRELWPDAVDALGRHANLGQAIAQARHVLEGRWGLSTLEVPLSRVCDSRAFRWFAAHLLDRAATLRDVHNASLAEYRRVNKVRSHTHPVPNLTADRGWIEVPFWLWSRDDPNRRPAFVQARSKTVELTDRQAIHITLPLHPESDAEGAVERLGEAHKQGIRLRPRALVTTMFARLLLSDLFIHGIGGAKYDHVTDAIMRRMWDVEPPAYLVVSATMKLPVPRRLVESRDINRINQLLRELRYHPELYVEETPETARLRKEKQQWLASNPPRGQRKQRHQAIERVNAALQPFVIGRREQLAREREELRSLLRHHMILNSREYAFCLFSEETLRPRLLELSRQEP